jgi:hypothetical protein
VSDNSGLGSIRFVFILPSVVAWRRVADPALHHRKARSVGPAVDSAGLLRSFGRPFRRRYPEANLNGVLRGRLNSQRHIVKLPRTRSRERNSIETKTGHGTRARAFILTRLSGDEAQATFGCHHTPVTTPVLRLIQRCISKSDEVCGVLRRGRDHGCNSDAYRGD